MLSVPNSHILGHYPRDAHLADVQYTKSTPQPEARDGPNFTPSFKAIGGLGKKFEPFFLFFASSFS